MTSQTNADNMLGEYLALCRARLDPAALGFPAGRRRTPGLRREEVALRAHISVAWYTLLEQGRGARPSASVLARLSSALMLTEAEREHLFLLALGRPPEVLYKPAPAVSPRLQRILDLLDPCPALIRSAVWDVVAWNRAATVFLTDFDALPPGQRNWLRLMFLDPHAREKHGDWDMIARFVVGAFRADTVRAGAADEVAPLVAELSELNPQFKKLWTEPGISDPLEMRKTIHHPELGPLSFEYSAFAVEGRSDLNLVIYNMLDGDAGKLALKLQENPS
ncbi:Helix-turn-helix domain-containing protein [Duganella sp. CF402]|uniref:helix-turn-helix transcriptional regulator n=1 Tax=unclassified Duganella TaxID=2636909 RepID=UPI0008C1F33E|nr:MULTISPECIES: helix-turn-helix transcriptional regulator [unclassified Duganella]RZT08849.1 helix-turn-helix protein [Duganella sp. BK701]SEL79562.1 Helix-turn-helix domain-containing protein [Duganella sp. CF402]